MKYGLPDLPKRLNRKNNFRRTIAKHWKSAVFTCTSRVNQLFLDNGSQELLFFRKTINDVKLHSPKAQAVCIQKCLIDWKVENLELFRLYCQDPFVQWKNESSQVSIHSSPLSLGKEVDRESIWTLCFRSHHQSNGNYYFSLLLHLNKIVPKMHQMRVAIVARFLNDEGRTVVTKELQNVLFKPSGGNEESSFHGFSDFLPFSVANDPKNNIGNSFHIQVELFIPGDPKRVKLSVPKKCNDNSRQVSKNISVRPSISWYEGCNVEVVARDRSFYVDFQKFEGHSKLKSLLQEDKSSGNLGIICLPDYSDRAVSALLTYIVGDYNDFVTRIEVAVDILMIAYEFSLPVLAHDMWLNIMFLMRLEHIPWITFLSYKYQAPEFVLNFVYIQLLSFMADLQKLKEFHFWAATQPQAFASMFINGEVSKELIDDTDAEKEKLKHEFYLREVTPGEVCSDDDSFGQVPIVVDEKYLEDSTNEGCHSDACECETCQRIRVCCNERLNIGYLARMKILEAI